MSTDRDTTRIVRSWIRTDEHVSADRILDDVLAALDTTPQRRSWWPAWRTPIMNNTVRLIATAAVVLVAAVIGYQLLIAPNVGGPAPAPSEAESASPTASPGLPALPVNDPTRLRAGTYELVDFPTFVTIRVPNAWLPCGTSEFEFAVCPGPQNLGVVSVLTVTNIAADACDPNRPLMDPPVGDSVADVVTALSGLQGFTATEATEITVDGFSGREFELTAPNSVVEACGEGIELPDGAFPTWSTGERTNGVGPGEVNLIRIFDVRGVLVMIAATYVPGGLSADDIATLQQVMDSVRFAE